VANTFRQLNFASGEVSPAVAARVDSGQRQSGLRTCRNSIIMKSGGVQNRNGTGFVSPITTPSTKPRLMAAVRSSTDNFIFELNDSKIRAYRNEVPVTKTKFRITGITQANPGVVTFEIPEGSLVVPIISGTFIDFAIPIGSMGELNGTTYYLKTLFGSGTTFTFDIYETDGTTPVDTTGFTAFVDTFTITPPLPLPHFTVATAITAITNADPCEVTLAGHPFGLTSEVYIDGVVGMEQLNGRKFIVGNKTATTFTLQDLDGNNIDSTDYGVYSSGGTSKRVCILETDYLENELPDLTYEPVFVPGRDDSNAVNGLDHTINPQTYLMIGSRTRGLSRIKISNQIQYYGTLTEASEEDIEFISDGKPIGITDSNGVTGTISDNNHSSVANFTVGYAVTAVGVNGEESLASYQTLQNRQDPSISGANDGEVYGWTGGQQSHYNVYKAPGFYISQAMEQVFGYIGSVTTNVFVDTGVTPDFTIQPPLATLDWAKILPHSVGSHNQRLVLARGSVIYMSSVGRIENFLSAAPVTDDSTIVARIAKNQTVLHFIESGEKLCAFTDAGVILIGGDASGIIKPSAVNFLQVSDFGCNYVKPVAIGGNIVYVDLFGSTIRFISPNDIESDLSAQEGDLTVYSSHLFRGKTITELAWRKSPTSILWATRSDGVLLGLTYMPEHQLFGWHRHDTDGEFESLVSVPFNGRSILYAVVKRTINGATARYIEKIAPNREEIDDAADAAIMDSHLSYDGTNEDTTLTMTLTGASLVSSSAYFTASEVGNAIVIEDAAGIKVKCVIISFVSSTQVTVTPTSAVPASLQATATAIWGRAVDTFTGLFHLEGENVSVLADGIVLHNPNRSDLVTKTVTNGTISFATTYVKIHVGLPFLSDVEPLDLDNPQGETLADKKKLVGSVGVQVEDTRGLYAGKADPGDADPDSEMDSMNIVGSSAAALFTGTKEVVIKSNWNNNGRVFLRQIDPLPFSILSILPKGLATSRGGR